MKTASWIIVEKASGKALFETYNRTTAQKINTLKYRVVPVMEWLQSLNAAHGPR